MAECGNCGRSFKGESGLAYHRGWCKGPSSPAHDTSPVRDASRAHDTVRARDVRVQGTAPERVVVKTSDYPTGVSGGPAWDAVDRVKQRAQVEATQRERLNSEADTARGFTIPKPSRGFRTGSFSLGSWSQNQSGNEKRTALGWDGRLRHAIGRGSYDRRRRLLGGP
jgi:hypothetical protein